MASLNSTTFLIKNNKMLKFTKYHKFESLDGGMIIMYYSNDKSLGRFKVFNFALIMFKSFSKSPFFIYSIE